MNDLGLEKKLELSEDIEELQKDRLEWLIIEIQSKNKISTAKIAIAKIEEQIEFLSGRLYNVNR